MKIMIPLSTLLATSIAMTNKIKIAEFKVSDIKGSGMDHYFGQVDLKVWTLLYPSFN